jgi:hypothetical protein
MMRNSTQMGIMFNLIDVETAVKADLVPLTREPEYREAFDRRIRRSLQDETGETFSAWYAQPTDIIIGKLKAWHEGRSAKHPADIHAMLVFALSGLSDVELDRQTITIAAMRLGPDVIELWRSLQERAEAEIQPSK